MSKKRTNVMADDAIYVIYTFGISAILLVMGMNMAFHG